MAKKKITKKLNPVSHTQEIITEFKNFLTNKTVLSMAVGLIIAGIVKDMVAVLVDGIIRPFIGLFLRGDTEFGALNVKIGNSVFQFGDLLSVTLQAFIIFAVLYIVFVKLLNKKEIFE